LTFFKKSVKIEPITEDHDEVIRRLNMNNPQKALVGVLAAWDNPEKNNSLARLFEYLERHKGKWNNFDDVCFLFTGGTFDRIIRGLPPPVGRITPVNTTTRNFLRDKSIRLPSHEEGGLIVLSYLIAQVQCHIVWSFLTLKGGHLINPSNQALFRLCDFWRATWLLNRGSVEEWLEYKADRVIRQHLQPFPPKIVLRPCSKDWCFEIKTQEEELEVSGKKKERFLTIPSPDLHSKEPDEEKQGTWKSRIWQDNLSKWTIALIAHDKLKEQMVKFATDYKEELDKFGCILATGTTGLYVREALVFTNEAQARNWMEVVIKRVPAAPPPPGRSAPTKMKQP
jgi:methylglyoxal synthase